MADKDMNLEKELQDLRARVQKLEAAVFTSKAPKKNSVESDSAPNFKGATGGVRSLISKGYFRSKRTFAEVTVELKSDGYLYSKQAFQEALSRLSRKGGPLITLKEGKNKVYADRK